MKILIDLLKIPRFSTLTLLTNPDFANLEVESIEITETPDIAHYIPEKTFLLTTAMVYKDNQQELKQLIDALKEKNASGLGIKVGRFIETIDPTIIDYANQVQLPIVQIPSTMPLGKTLHQLLNVLWDTKTEQLSYALDIQQNFSDMLVNDVSIPRFIESFSKLASVPIILLNPYRKVLAYSKHFSTIDTPAEYYVKQLIEQEPNFHNKKSGSLLLTDSKQKTLQIAYHSVEAHSYFPHVLIILHPEQIPFPVSEFAIDQAKLVLSFMLYKNQKVQESLHYLKSDFLTRMIEYQQSPTQQERDWLDLGINFGLVKARHYRIVYIGCYEQDSSQKIRHTEEASQVAFNWLEDELYYRIKDMSLFKIKNQNHFVLFVQHRLDDLEDILLDVAHQLKRRLPIQLLFGIGYVYDSIHQVAKSFVEAKQAYEDMLLSDTAIEQTIAHYRPKGMRHLFEKIDMTDIHYFCESTLHELAYPTESSLIELRRTLQCYLAFQCEIALTAKTLFVHRNTIKYRIDRCQKILGQNLHDPQTSLNIRLALELSENTTE